MDYLKSCTTKAIECTNVMHEGMKDRLSAPKRLPTIAAVSFTYC
jgi:hypothetical protein